MRYAGIIKNDISAAPGVCTTFFTQGCPHRCRKCHNPETWDFDGGKEFSTEVIQSITTALTANGIKRNFCIMGGEPLCDENLFITQLVINQVKSQLPDIKIYVWTGYLYEELLERNHNNPHLNYILENTDVLIDGPYIDELRDITLPMRGSTNQRIINLKEIKE